MKRTLLCATVACLVAAGCTWPVHDAEGEHEQTTSRLERPADEPPKKVLTYWDASTPDSPTKRLSEFAVPSFASLERVTMEAGNGGGNVVFELDGELPAPSSDSLVLEAYIEESDGNVTSVAVFAFDQAQLDTDPKLLAGEAAIVSVETGEILSRGAVSIEGKQVTLTFKSGLKDASTLHSGIARFLPAAIPVERVSGGLSTCWTSCLRPWALAQPMMMVPILPGVPTAE